MSTGQLNYLIFLTVPPGNLSSGSSSLVGVVRLNANQLGLGLLDFRQLNRTFYHSVESGLGNRVKPLARAITNKGLVLLN